MATAVSKLPTVEKPMIKDPTMVTELEKLLAPLTGKALERAQQAVRLVYPTTYGHGFQKQLAMYAEAIKIATKGAPQE